MKKANAEQKLWETKLRKLGLSMDAGRDPGHRKLLRIGGSSEIEALADYLLSKNGRVRPIGAGPEE